MSPLSPSRVYGVLRSSHTLQRRTQADIERDAAKLLEDAIRAGRLPARPDLATLSRIAAIIGPVLSKAVVVAEEGNTL